jgi:hypothetical protein
MRSSWRRSWIVGGVAVALALTACSSPPEPESEPEEVENQAPIVGPNGSGLFAGEGNPWFEPVPEDAAVDERSEDYVAQLLTEIPLVSVNGWTVPVYETDGSAPRYTVDATEDFTAGGWSLPDVPIPDAAAPDPQDDGHMVVLDRSSECVYEFWQARREGETWTASWVNATPADGDGIYPDGLSSRAGGLSAAAGLIWPQELRAGEIDHALVFAYPFTRAGDPTAPATASDGRTDGEEAPALPMGARLRLDPSLDLDSLGLSRSERTIARALQEYGMILGDSSGGFTIYAAAPQSYTNFPYPRSWSQDIWANISGIPFDRMQVLDFPDPEDPYSGPPVTNRCNENAPGDSGDED